MIPKVRTSERIDLHNIDICKVYHSCLKKSKWASVEQRQGYRRECMWSLAGCRKNRKTGSTMWESCSRWANFTQSSPSTFPGSRRDATRWGTTRWLKAIRSKLWRITWDQQTMGGRQTGAEQCRAMPKLPLVPKWPKVTLSQWRGRLGTVNVTGNISISGNWSCLREFLQH